MIAEPNRQDRVREVRKALRQFLNLLADRVAEQLLNEQQHEANHPKPSDHATESPSHPKKDQINE
ncbi:hypothetical protein [Zavarzinella formosa]|uniref:hypothetical protein n=1 Tax=Zavarzinella formosa TaxID=360055 RepID=UPI0002DB7319|nr:hypothetical protein [Zavarzinella formosa]